MTYITAVTAEFYNTVWPRYAQQLGTEVLGESVLRYASHCVWVLPSTQCNTQCVTKTGVPEIWAIRITAAGKTWLNLQCPDWVIQLESESGVVTTQVPY